MATQIQTQIASARKAGYSDQEIFQGILKSPKYGNGFEQARAAGHSNNDIAQGLGLNLGNTQKIQIKGGKVNVEMQPIRLTAEGKPYKQFDNTKAARNTRDQEALNKQGPTQAWESALLSMADKGAPVLQAFSYAGDGISSGINKVLGTNLRTDSYEAVTRGLKTANKNHETVRKANNQGADVIRIGTDIATTLPLSLASGGVGVLKAGAPLLSRAGGAFLAENAALGGLIGATGVHENNTDRLKNMVVGAAGGAAGGVIGKKIGDGVTRVINIKRGRMNPAAQEVNNLGKQFNVKTSVGDADRNSIVQKAEVNMEQIPLIGTSGFRKGQHDQAQAAALKITDRLKNTLDDVDFKSVGKIRTAANSGDKNAMRIMGIVNGAGDDTGRILQAAAEIKNWRGQKVTSQLYERVGSLAGNNPVAPSKTVQAIDNVVAKDSKVTPNKELLGEINAIRKNLLDPNININFKEMRAAQSRLGELVDEWGRQGKSTSGLTKIRTAIDDDIVDFAQSSGNTGLISELKRANSVYRQLQNGKDKAFAASMRSDKPDEIFKQFMQVGKGDKASNFYKNLDPKGQAALRYQMAENALNKATNENTGNFSPAKFALEFERMNAPYSKIFNGADKAQMDGFVKLMRHVERAGQYMENPPTGNRTVGLAMAGGAALNAPLAIKIGGATAIAKTLFTTEAGKRILLSAKDVPPNSPQMANLLKQVQKLSTVAGANTATQ